MTSGKQGKKKRNNQKKSIPSPSSEVQTPDSKTAENVGKSDGEKSPNNELNSKVESLQKMIEENCENQKNQTKMIEDIRENQQKLILENIEHQQKMLEKFEQLDGDIRENRISILEKLDKTEKDDSKIEKKPSFNSVISPGSLMKNAPSTGIPSIGRSFVLKHTFKDVSEFEEGKKYYSEDEDHFGVPWRLYVYKCDEHLAFFLQCNQPLESRKWAINIKFTLKLIDVERQATSKKSDYHYGNSNGNTIHTATGWPKFIAWDQLKKEYLVDDKLSVEVHVEILEMSGIYKENLRSFDESMKDVSDVVLVVGKQKFYISKLCLASHSSYFKTLFLGNFQESNQSEVELSGICPEDFQNYLEVLYAELSIDDTTVEGILMLADMYDTSIVIGKCKDFLVEKSQKSLKKKLQMAIRYNLHKLKSKCLSEIKTKDDLKSVSTEDPKDLDHSILVELYKKSLSFQ